MLAAHAAQLAGPAMIPTMRGDAIEPPEIPLHPRQRECLESDATEILYGGAAGGGKSYLMRAAAIIWSCRHPGLQVYMFRRTYPELLRTHLEGTANLREMLGPLVARGDARVVMATRPRIEFSNSSIIHLCHLQHERTKYDFQSAEIHALLPDELTHFSDTQYRYLRGRLRASEELRLPRGFPRVVAGSNPGGVGHAWVKAAWVDPQPPGTPWNTPSEEGGMRRAYLPARLGDNPSIDADEYRKKLLGLGDPDLVEAMLNGSWDIAAGAIFAPLWCPAAHVLPVFQVPESWPVYRALDWGESAPYSVGWWTVADGSTIQIDGRLYRTVPDDRIQIGELYGWNGRPNEGCELTGAAVAQLVKKYEAEKPWGERVQPGPADSAIYSKIEGSSVAEAMAETADIRWTPAEKGPGSRVTRAAALRQRLRAQLPGPLAWELERARKAAGNGTDPGAGRERPGIAFVESCRHSIRTLPVLPRSQRDPDDVDTNAEDHAYDMATYGLQWHSSLLEVSNLRLVF